MQEMTAVCSVYVFKHWNCCCRISGFKRAQLPQSQRFQLRRNQEAAVGIRRSQTSDQTWERGGWRLRNCKLQVARCFRFCCPLLTVISISVSPSTPRKVDCYDIWEEEHQNENVHRNRCLFHIRTGTSVCASVTHSYIQLGINLYIILAELYMSNKLFKETASLPLSKNNIKQNTILVLIVSVLIFVLFMSCLGSIICLCVGVIQCFLFYFEILSVSYFPCPVKRCPSDVFD